MIYSHSHPVEEHFSSKPHRTIENVKRLDLCARRTVESQNLPGMSLISSRAHAIGPDGLDASPTPTAKQQFMSPNIKFCFLSLSTRL